MNQVFQNKIKLKFEKKIHTRNSPKTPFRGYEKHFVTYSNTVVSIFSKLHHVIKHTFCIKQQLPANKSNDTCK